ncbi:MAG: TonB-dependent receptor, partial [Kangiellaceae bacterium]|nr:TonB-dependent receptor [Kangiellaceae bacterium]
TNVAQNTAKQDGTGAELEIRWKYSEKIDLKFGYAWQNAEDAENNQEIADAPGQMIDFSLNWKLTDDLNMYFDTRWIIDRNRLSTDSRLKIKDYNWTNVSLKYQVTPNFDTQLTIRNLADSDAFEPSDGQILGDYPLEERGVWFAMTYQY